MSSKMRALVFGLSLAVVSAAVLPGIAAAQNRDRDREQSEDSAEDRAKKDEEWGQKDLRLAKRRADGPCPFVKVLYDAARYQDFEGGKEASAEAKWTGQINGVASDCAYKGGEPIEIEMIVGFSLGKGPKAGADSNTYRYWVAVTDRDETVLAKEYFDLPVNFNGKSSVDVATRIENIVIPRAAASIAGDNFEVLIGFDVTPQMVEFNRQGKRFRFAKVKAQ
ncbi:Tat pathway signal sequence domain protein [Asticcacaulis sp. BYS171W]|uniref:Tat pathway signal sequence domain protein n=1 Tax=Asticcacaulis aquaticus TaxID=2984212 RepID=A0ABT5HUY1_9CAUL|nr:Tat pathway signal sequence domain protein [Asticcacaulis aquaticus]MDC7683784.1 Tat pathway signal sequence domain protein [Asticcacaulis aquaticus]